MYVTLCLVQLLLINIVSGNSRFEAWARVFVVAFSIFRLFH